ncbi:MAG: hypothetical protein PHE55_06260 [Methylococcaceae bacterium]|nr:hypothetical protein [Methylococcaceae bacterium]
MRKEIMHISLHKTGNNRLAYPLSGFMLLVFTAGLSLFSVNTYAHVISPEDHHAFEHKYAEMCIKKELKNNPNPGYVDPALSKLCECIAQEESKRLTIAEVKKFLRENKYPMSLMIKAGQAEYICSQKK